MSTYSNRLQPALQNLLRVVRFFHPKLSCTTTHISADIQRISLNASCMTISGERTDQLDIFCRVTGFTSDFLSFIDVELIRFFHGALQFCNLFCWTARVLCKTETATHRAVLRCCCRAHSSKCGYQNRNMKKVERAVLTRNVPDFSLTYFSIWAGPWTVSKHVDDDYDDDGDAY